VPEGISSIPGYVRDIRIAELDRRNQ
jgi:hypothetical protein